MHFLSGEHLRTLFPYLDMGGVTGSNPVPPTTPHAA